MANLESKLNKLLFWRSLLDTIRDLIILTTTVIAVCLIWKIHWLLAIVAAAPVYILMLIVVGFLTLPLYALAGYACGFTMSEILDNDMKGEAVTENSEEEK